MFFSSINIIDFFSWIHSSYGIYNMFLGTCKEEKNELEKGSMKSHFLKSKLKEFTKYVLLNLAFSSGIPFFPSRAFVAETENNQRL